MGDCFSVYTTTREQVYNKETGTAYQPDEHEAFDRVSQKIRDIKKYRLKAANNPVVSRKVSQKRTSKHCLSFLSKWCCVPWWLIPCVHIFRR